jgi:STE24 endopeptidase
MVGIFMLVFWGSVLLVFAPISYALGYTLPRKYGLMPMSASAWWVDYVKSSGLILLWVVAIAVVYHWIVRTNKDWWWLIVAILWWGIIWLIQYLCPLDRFGTKKLTLVEDNELTNRLSRLTERAGLPAMTLWMLPVSKKTTTANSWYLGLGRKRRLVVTDTMIGIYNYDEMEAMLAHKLGHFAANEIVKQLALHGVVIFAMTLITYWLIGHDDNRTGLGGAADVATLTYPMMAYIMYSCLYSAIDGARSRKVKAEADRYAIELTGNPDAFKSVMLKLADLNLTETHPSGRTRNLQRTHSTMADVAASRPSPSSPQDEGWKRPAKRVARYGGDEAGESDAQGERYSAARHQYTPFVVRRIRI